MADYFSPTVVRPNIPLADMTAIEQLLLTAVFESEIDDDDTLYLFAPVFIDQTPALAIPQVRTALAEGPDCRTAAYIRERLAACTDDEYLQLEDDTPWEAALQDVVRRSAAIDHVEIVTAYTCSRMRPDGFGGAVTIITADQILSSSTQSMTSELLDRAHYGELGCAPGFGCHVLLRLAEENVRSTLDEFFETEAPPGLAIEDVTDVDIREACFAVRADIDLSHEEGEAVFAAAMRAMRIAAERKAAAT